MKKIIGWIVALLSLLFWFFCLLMILPNYIQTKHPGISSNSGISLIFSSVFCGLGILIGVSLIKNLKRLLIVSIVLLVLAIIIIMYLYFFVPPMH